MDPVGVFQPLSTTEKCEEAIEKIITIGNFNWTRKLAIISFLASLILLFTDYLNHSKGLWMITDGYKYLLYAHVVMSVGTFLFVLSSYKIIVHSQDDITLAHKLYGILFALFTLSLAAIISGWIDQKIHGQITTYVICCFILAVMYSYKPRVVALLYSSSGLLFLILIIISQEDLVIRQGHYINAAFLLIVSYLLSIVFYQFRRQDLLHKYYLEDLVAERTKELQTANALLTQEIIDRERAELEMARLDRFKLIGEMAAGISHEVRNPMTTVKGFLQLLKHKQDTKDQEFFDLMIEELDRANSILSEFLSINRTGPTVLECHNINDIITSTLPLFQADASNNDQVLTIELTKVPNSPLNLQEIRQLLLNLVRNGLEAMSSGGQLRIRTFSANSQVVLAVSDEGNGMDQHVLEKLGTPFFTTKDQGTGLGLAVCYAIVSRHNGKISVESSAKGSTFQVSFELSK